MNFVDYLGMRYDMFNPPPAMPNYTPINSESQRIMNLMNREAGVTQKYCDAAIKYPQNKWLSCACSVSKNIQNAIKVMIGSFSAQVGYTFSGETTKKKIEWFYCTRNCISSKWEAAFNKWEGHSDDRKLHAELTPAWDSFCKECEGKKVSEQKCCELQVQAEQKGLQDCMDSCGKWQWGANEFPMNFVPVSDFNNLDQRVNYGIKYCCSK